MPKRNCARLSETLKDSASCKRSGTYSEWLPPLNIGRACRAVKQVVFFGQLILGFFLLADSPLLNLSLGSNLDADGIKEGDDVYFECDASARPPVHTIHWKRNVSGLVCMGSRFCSFLAPSNRLWHIYL